MPCSAPSAPIAGAFSGPRRSPAASPVAPPPRPLPIPRSPGRLPARLHPAWVIYGILGGFTPWITQISGSAGRCRMGLALRKSVVLIGMMGAGKTAVGQALARRLAVPFLDSDAEIERAAARSIAEIFARDGEPF